MYLEIVDLGGGERQLSQAYNVQEPLPPCGMVVVGVGEKHARVAREPRSDRARQQDRRAKAAVVEVLPRCYRFLERRLVQKGVQGVGVDEVQVHELV